MNPLSINPIVPDLPISAPVPGGKGPDLAKTARDFESVLLLKVIEEMSRTVDEDGLLSSASTKQVNQIFQLSLAKELADKGGIGLWKQILRQMQPDAGPQGPVQP